jgi:hypothetical protein
VPRLYVARGELAWLNTLIEQIGTGEPAWPGTPQGTDDRHPHVRKALIKGSVWWLDGSGSGQATVSVMESLELTSWKASV